MITATVFAPDGKQLLSPDGHPLEYSRATEHRAFLSAQKSWWPVGPKAKRGIGPKWGVPPAGSEIRMDGHPFRRFEEVPVFDAKGEIVDTRMEWLDITARAQADDRAERVAAYIKRMSPSPSAYPSASGDVPVVAAPHVSVELGEGGGPTHRRRG